MIQEDCLDSVKNEESAYLRVERLRSHHHETARRVRHQQNSYMKGVTVRVNGTNNTLLLIRVMR